jgi:SnoaL-like domain
VLSDLEKLMAIEELKGLRIRFCRAIDTRDWDKLEGTMTEQARLYFADETGTGKLNLDKPVELKGRAAILDFVRQFTGDRKMVHIATMPEIEFQSADKARGSWNIEGFSAGMTPLGLVGIGYEDIVDDYVRTKGKWFIANIDCRIKAVA